MAGPGTVDSLQIEIGASSSDAASNIDKLASSLGNLKSVAKGGAGLTAAKNQIEKLGAALRSVSEQTATLDKLSSIFQRVGQSSSGMGTAASALKQAGAAAKSAKADYSALTPQVDALAKEFAQLPPEYQKAATAAANAQKAINALSGQKVNISVDSAKESLSELSKATTKANADLKSIKSSLSGDKESVNAVSNAFASLPPSVQKAITAIAKMEATNNKTSKSFSLLRNSTLNFAAATVAIQKVYMAAGKAVNSMNEYIENVNLFEVSMGEFYEEAFAYAELVNKKMGIDPSEWMRNQGVFMSMAKGFGLANDKAYQLSEGLTELSYDISSLYNEDVESAAKRLQSALAGEIEPIRRLGISITQATLQEYALSKGIQETVTNMTEQEKALLRSLKIIEDANRIGAVGDFAKTLESPANAIRILKQQITQLARAIGSVLLPILTQIIPWIQAFVSVITDAIKALAAFVGFTMPDWGDKDWEGQDFGFGDTEDAIKGATGAAKEFKRQLMGIDELTVLQEPASGGAGGAGDMSDWAAGLEIPDVWDKNIIANLQTQAEGLKDTIKDLLKLISGVAAGLAAWSIAGRFLKDLGVLSRLLGAIMIGAGVTLLIDTISDILIDGRLTLDRILKGGAGGALAGGGVGLMLAKKLGLSWKGGILVGAVVGLGVSFAIMGISAMIGDKSVDIGDIVMTALGSMLSGAGIGAGIAIKTGAGLFAGAGIGAVIGFGISLVISGITSQIMSGVNFKDAIMTILGSVLTGAAIGSVIPGLGTAVGAVIGLVVGVALEFLGIKKAGEAAYQASEGFQVIQNVLDRCEAASQRASDAMERLKSGIQNVDTVSSDFALASKLVDEIYAISDNANASNYELEQMAIKVDVLNGLNIDGLKLSIDETSGRVVETREQVESLIESLQREAKMEAMRDLLVQTYKDQYQALVDSERALRDYDIASESLANTVAQLDSLSWFDFKKRAELTAKQKAETEAVNAAQQAYAASRDALDELDSAIDIYSEALVDLKAAEEEIGVGVVDGLDVVRQSMEETATSMTGYGENIAETLRTAVDENTKENEYKSIWQRIGDWFKNVFGINSPSTVMMEYGGYITQGLYNGITSKWDSIKEFFTSGLEDIWDDVTNFFDLSKWKEKAGNIPKAISSAWNDTVSFWTKNVPQWWSQNVAPWFTLQKWAGIAKNIGTAVKGSFSSMVTEWKSSISSWWSRDVSPWFSVSKWKDLGKSALDGLFNGLSNIGNKVKTWGNSVISKVKGVFDINSPSRVFQDEIGINLGLGVAKGILSSERDVLASVAKLNLGMQKEFAGLTYDIQTQGVPEIPDHSSMFVRYRHDVSSRQTSDVEVTADDFGARMQDNSDSMINMMMAAAQQIIRAIQENGNTVVNIGGREVTDSQNRQNRMYGRTLQNT